MKNIISALLFLLVGLGSKAQFNKAELQASGLTCSMCSNAINKALKTLPFVESVQTDLNKNLFTIVFKKDLQPDFDAISKKVEDAGFAVAKFWVSGNVKDLSIDPDTHVELNGLNLHFMNVKPQTLNGPARFQVIDRHFVLAKDYKKLSMETGMPCYQTGVLGDCCKPLRGDGAGNRVYHVTI